MEMQRFKWTSGEQPTLYTRRGVINDFVLMLMNAMTPDFRIEEARLLLSNSLLPISHNPSLADSDTAARLFLNFPVQPDPG